MKYTNDGGPQAGIPWGSGSKIWWCQKHSDVWKRLAETEKSATLSKQSHEKLGDWSLVRILVKLIDNQIGQVSQDDHMDLKKWLNKLWQY